MNKKCHTPRRRLVVDYAAATIEQMKVYCAAHPESPSPVRRPQLFFRSDLWIALLGRNVEESIVGIGPTVAAALRAFDAQYLAGLRPPTATAGKIGTPAPVPESFRGSAASVPESKPDPNIMPTLRVSRGHHDDSSNRLSNSGV